MKNYQKINFDPVVPYEDNDYSDVTCAEFGLRKMDADGNVIGYNKASPMCMSCTLHVICPMMAHLNTREIKIKEIKEELNQDFFLDESKIFNLQLVDQYLQTKFENTEFPCKSSDLLDDFTTANKRVFQSLDPAIPKYLLRRFCNKFELTPNHKLHLIPDEPYEINRSS